MISGDIQGYKVYPDLAGQGDDLGAVRGRSCDWTLSDCAGACNATSDCQAFVVDIQSRDRPDIFCCYLKTFNYFNRIIGMRQRESGGASFLKQGIGAVPEGPVIYGFTPVVRTQRLGVDLPGTPVDAPGNDIRHYCYTNVGNCAQSCLGDGSCIGFSFRYDDYFDKGGKNCCYLKSKMAEDSNSLPSFRSIAPGLIGYTYRSVT